VVETVFERGWATLANGALIQSAETAGFDLFVTTDKNLRYQQNLASRGLAIAVLWTTSWPFDPSPCAGRCCCRAGAASG
jgi:hypothetical protein